MICRHCGGLVPQTRSWRQSSFCNRACFLAAARLRKGRKHAKKAKPAAAGAEPSRERFDDVDGKLQRLVALECAMPWDKEAAMAAEVTRGPRQG